jgi:predicted ATPase
VDDLQWADGSSLDLLGLIIRRAPIQMVLAYRPEEVDETGTVAGFLNELPTLGGHVTTVALEPLRPEAISELVSDEKLARVIAEATDRTPHALEELIRALAREGSIQSDEKGRWRARRGDAAARVREVAMAGQARAIQRRAALLPPRAHRLLLLLALLGREACARLLARASDASQAEVLADLDVASRAGLVHLGEKGWAVAHDLIGEALAENLLQVDRGRLHGALAAALSAEGEDAAEDEDAAEIAHHLEGAGDAEGAARAFGRAGRLMLDRFAGDEAGCLAERGLSLNPTPESRAELLEIRGEVRARRGDLTAARDDLRAALAQVGPGAARAHLLARLAVLTSGLEDYVQAGELVDLALTEALSGTPARAEALAIGPSSTRTRDASTGRSRGRTRPSVSSSRPETPRE